MRRVTHSHPFFSIYEHSLSEPKLVGLLQPVQQPMLFFGKWKSGYAAISLVCISQKIFCCLSFILVLKFYVCHVPSPFTNIVIGSASGSYNWNSQVWFRKVLTKSTRRMLTILFPKLAMKMYFHHNEQNQGVELVQKYTCALLHVIHATHRMHQGTNVYHHVRLLMHWYMYLPWEWRYSIGYLPVSWLGLIRGQLKLLFQISYSNSWQSPVNFAVQQSSFFTFWLKTTWCWTTRNV